MHISPYQSKKALTVFSCIRTEHRKIRTSKNYVFRHFLRSENLHTIWVVRRDRMSRLKSKSISSIAGRNILLLWNLVQGHPVKRNCPFKLGLRKYLLTMFKIFLIYVVNKVHIFLTLSWRRSQSHRNHGFYMIGTSIIKELMQKLKVCNCTLHLCLGFF